MRSILNLTTTALIIFCSFFLFSFQSIGLDYEQLLDPFLAEENPLSNEDVAELQFYKGNFIKNIHLLSATDAKEVRIPKVIHVIWLGPKAFPTSSIKNLQLWKKFHPDWLFKFWTDFNERPCPIEGMEKHIIKDSDFEKLGRFYHQSKNYAEKSDLLRYEILFREGGVYIDHDIECYRSFGPFHLAYDFYAGLEPIHESPTRDTQFSIGNCIIGVKPKHPILSNTIERIENNWDRFQQKFPQNDNLSNFLRVLNRTFDSFHFSARAHLGEENNIDIIFPTAFFYGKTAFTQKHHYYLKKAKVLYANHFWSHTWLDSNSDISFLPSVKFHNSDLCRKINKIIAINCLISASTIALIFLTIRRIRPIYRIRKSITS